MNVNIKITQAEGLDGSLLVEAEGEIGGVQAGPLLFSYEPANPAKIASLEIATMARDAYNRLYGMVAVEV
jgi:hypothetical protein